MARDQPVAGQIPLFRPDSRLKASPGLVSVPGKTPPGQSGYVGVYDFLTKNFVFVPQEAFYWFEYFQNERSWLEVLRDHRQLEIDEIQNELRQLIEPGFLALAGTAVFKTHREFEKTWKWDLSAALFHFTACDANFLTEVEAQKQTADRARKVPQPPQSWKHGNTAVRLSSPAESRSKELFNILGKRRTVRASAGHRLAGDEISDCLYAGLGITGYVDTASGALPLKFAPSGGARNPFEAFLVLNRGTDLASGVYHYSAAEHSLSLLSNQLPSSFAPYLAKQAWVEDMAGYIFLVAVMERTMWKYQDPNAYRVVLIEAGHIAQNIMLIATNLGLTICPTAALAHSEVSRLLNLEALTHVPVYALTIDRAGTTADTIHENPISVPHN